MVLRSRRDRICKRILWYPVLWSVNIKWETPIIIFYQYLHLLYNYINLNRGVTKMYYCKHSRGFFLFLLSKRLTTFEKTKLVFVSMTADSPCFPNPCKNRGQCTVEGTSFSCSCLHGFSGNNCEIQAIG